MTKHANAELMLEYAKDAMETDTPHARWEYTNESINGWADCAGCPYWDSQNTTYRRKPKPYEPTLLDEALELEIESARLKANHYGDKMGVEFSIYANKHATLRSLRTPETIKHLKSQGKI